MAFQNFDLMLQEQTDSYSHNIRLRKTAMGDFSNSLASSQKSIRPERTEYDIDFLKKHHPCATEPARIIQTLQKRQTVFQLYLLRRIT